MRKNEKITALYERLSRDDFGKDDDQQRESNSISNQKAMPSAELEKAVNERGISSRTMRTAKSRIGDRLVTEKDSTAWVCYLRD